MCVHVRETVPVCFKVGPTWRVYLFRYGFERGPALDAIARHAHVPDGPPGVRGGVCVRESRECKCRMKKPSRVEDRTASCAKDAGAHYPRLRNGRPNYWLEPQSSVAVTVGPWAGPSARRSLRSSVR